MSRGEVVSIEMPWHREGISHLEYALRETEDIFRQGRRDDGIISLAHCLYVQATEGNRLDEDEAKAWFGRLTDAAGVWGHGA